MKTIILIISNNKEVELACKLKDQIISYFGRRMIEDIMSDYSNVICLNQEITPEDQANLSQMVSDMLSNTLGLALVKCGEKTKSTSQYLINLIEE